MYQPYPSTGQPTEATEATEPPRPPAPAPVLTAVKLMYAGAAISIVTLITEVALTPAVKAALHTADPGLTAAQADHVNVLLALEIVLDLITVALWLWMARANGRGRNWARILSTVLSVLVGLATLKLIWAPKYRGGYLARITFGGHTYSMIHSVFAAAVFGVVVPVLTSLIGLTAVWLLWRPASRVFFKPQRFV